MWALKTMKYNENRRRGTFLGKEEVMGSSPIISSIENRLIYKIKRFLYMKTPRKAWGSEELKAMRKTGKLLLLTMKLRSANCNKSKRRSLVLQMTIRVYHIRNGTVNIT